MVLSFFCYNKNNFNNFPTISASFWPNLMTESEGLLPCLVDVRLFVFFMSCHDRERVEGRGEGEWLRGSNRDSRNSAMRSSSRGIAGIRCWSTLHKLLVWLYPCPLCVCCSSCCCCCSASFSYVLFAVGCCSCCCCCCLLTRSLCLRHKSLPFMF